jgi:four helix bundle protein
MTKEELKDRFKRWAISTARLCNKLPFNPVNKVFVGQLLRCSTSSAANYRAACRAKSKADFINKLRIVEEEADESMFFFEMLQEFNAEFANEIIPLHKEANELLSITIAAINTTLTNIEIEKQKIKSINQKI